MFHHTLKLVKHFFNNRKIRDNSFNETAVLLNTFPISTSLNLIQSIRRRRATNGTHTHTHTNYHSSFYIIHRSLDPLALILLADIAQQV